jgi:hypothetical protein
MPEDFRSRGLLPSSSAVYIFNLTTEGKAREKPARGEPDLYGNIKKMFIISINRYKSSYLLNINLHRHHSHKNKIFVFRLSPRPPSAARPFPQRGDSEDDIFAVALRAKCGESERIYGILTTTSLENVLILLNFYDSTCRMSPRFNDKLSSA